MAQLTDQTKQNIRDMVSRAVSETKVTDIHTHLYSAGFGEVLLWGIDELLTYHYLVAETMRYVNMSYEDFWNLSKREQADLIWKTLFLDHSPISESCRGVLTCIDKLGLDVASRDLESFRQYYAQQNVDGYIDKVFELANLESVVMTNDPFDDLERPTWFAGIDGDDRFHAALRIDGLLNTWEAAVPKLREWGYRVNTDFAGDTFGEVSRFLGDWVDRMGALYMAVSLPPTFAFPEDSARSVLIENCVLPVAEAKGIPFAIMVGVKKLTNPQLRLAGDSVGKSDINVVEHLCSHYPNVKFLVTMLARENQHELCVAARKFGNLHIFGCWWFLNNPSIIDEMTRMRLELLGLSVTPQHSDARVLDQLIYKWSHSRAIIGEVLVDKYCDLAATGWQTSEEEIRRDVADLFGGQFWAFLKK